MEDNDKEKGEEKKSNSKIPVLYIVGGIIVLILLAQRTKITGESSQTFWMVLLGILLILWLLKSPFGLSRTPRWAQIQISKRVDELKEDGYLPKLTEVNVEPYGDLIFYSKNPNYYMFSVKFIFSYTNIVQNMAKVYLPEGHVTFVKSLGNIYGDEKSSVYPILPQGLKFLQKNKLERYFFIK